MDENRSQGDCAKKDGLKTTGWYLGPLTNLITHHPQPKLPSQVPVE